MHCSASFLRVHSKRGSDVQPQSTAILVLQRPGRFCKNAWHGNSPNCSRPRARPACQSAFGKTRTILALALTALLVLCFVFLWTTRDAMENLSFLRQKGGAPSRGGQEVARRSWPMANGAGARARWRSPPRRPNTHAMPNGSPITKWIRLLPRHFARPVCRRSIAHSPATRLALSQKVTQLKQLIKQDQALVAKPDRCIGARPPMPRKPQPSGWIATISKSPRHNSALIPTNSPTRSRISSAPPAINSAQIQGELAAHEASMRQYDSQAAQGTARSR